MARQIVVELVGDAKSLSKATKEAESFANRIKKAWSAPELKKGFLGGLGIGAGLGAANVISRGIGMVTDTIGDAIDAASDWGEATSKVSVVFEDQAGIIQRWARSASTSMGMSEREALKAAGTFGNLFDGLGLTEDAAVEMSKSVVQLAADLGSFNNVATDEALTALQSGLLGEAEPMRRFGVALSEAKVQAYGMANGLGEMVKSGKTYKFVMSDAQKVQARWGIILENTSNAQGDFARTSDGLANSQKTLNAEVDDLRVEIGKLMQGPAKGFVRFLTDVVNGIDNIREALGDNSRKLDTYMEKVELLGAQYGLTAKQARELESQVQLVFEPGLTDAQKMERRMAALRSRMSQLAQGTKVAGRGIREDFGGAVGKTIPFVDQSFKDLIKSWDELPDTWPKRTAAIELWLRQHASLIRKYYANVPMEIKIAAIAAGTFAGPQYRPGPAFQLQRTTRAMFTTMADFMDPWKTAWKEAVAWAKDPFSEKKFGQQMREMIRKTMKKAARAGADGFKSEQKRLIEVANAMRWALKHHFIDPSEKDILALVRALRSINRIKAASGTGRMASNEKVGGRASGGPVSAGRTYWVGEKGPELLTMPANGYVTANHQLSGGGDTYNINVHVAPGTSPAQVGKELVAAIQAYQRNGGAAHVKRAVLGG